MMEQYIYRAEFNLEYSVNDITAARKYLEEDNDFLLEDLKEDIFRNTGEDVSEKLVSITWNLKFEDSGYIELVSTEELDDQVLETASLWISGQNSDGLGEGFEQQDFASYNTFDEDPYFDDEEEDYDDGWVMASFDWKTNKYKLKLFKVK